MPAATDLMLYILSLDGQATLKRFGFNPVGLPSSFRALKVSSSS